MIRSLARIKAAIALAGIGLAGAALGYWLMRAFSAYRSPAMLDWLDTPMMC